MATELWDVCERELDWRSDLCACVRSWRCPGTETLSNETIPVLYESSECINISEDFKISFFWAGFSRKIERGWGGPESSTERLWDVQESASRDGELFMASVFFKDLNVWQWQYVSSSAVMLLVLGAQEGILQRLQSSVEQEETCWKEKLERSQADLREVGKTNTLHQFYSYLNHSFHIVDN